MVVWLLVNCSVAQDFLKNHRGLLRDSLRVGEDGRHSVHHHPVSCQEAWLCPPCVLDAEERRARAVVTNRLERVRKRARDLDEEDRLTTMAQCQPGRYVKGFVGVFRFNPGNKWNAFYLNESQWDPKLNPTPPCIKIMSQTQAVWDKLNANRHRGVCVLVKRATPYEFRPYTDRMTGRPVTRDTRLNPERFILWDVDDPARIVPGFALPPADDDDE